MKKLTNKKAFTLTELIVVIVIIGILAAVLVPSLTTYIEKARKSAIEQEAVAYKTAYETWVIEDAAGLVTYADDTADTDVAKFTYYLQNEVKMTAPTFTTVSDGFTYTVGDYTVNYVHSTGALTATKQSA